VDKDTLLARTTKTESGCLEWAGYRHRQGYGVLTYLGKQWKAHRLSYVLSHGEIPEGLFVLHRCDNPPCINPDHLWAGTQRDNVMDMVGKGRARRTPLRGEKSPTTTLTEDDVRAIRADPRRHAEIAASYGIAKSTVTGITTRRRWRHVV
jgi:hypothetical protein